MSSTDDAGDQIGEASVGALHTLVPAAEELDLVEELRADQYWRSLEVDRLYPDWVDLQGPVEPEPDTRSAVRSSHDERDGVDPWQLTHAQALGLVAHVLGGEPVPPESPQPMLDAPGAAAPDGSGRPRRPRISPAIPENVDDVAVPPRPLSPHYWALRKMLDDAGVELVPTDRDLASSQHDVDDDDL